MGLLVLGRPSCPAAGWLSCLGRLVLRHGPRRSCGRYFLLRVAYAGLLLFILFTVSLDVGWQTTDHRGPLPGLKFLKLSCWCSSSRSHPDARFRAGPSHEEKDRKTMEFLLATDLRNRETS